MLTAIEGNTKIGQLLLDRGANINALNDFGENALSCAALKGHLRFVQLLISNGASSDVRPHGNVLHNWIAQFSGLTESQIADIVDAISHTAP